MFIKGLYKSGRFLLFVILIHDIFFVVYFLYTIPSTSCYYLRLSTVYSLMCGFTHSIKTHNKEIGWAGSMKHPIHIYLPVSKHDSVSNNYFSENLNIKYSSKLKIRWVISHTLVTGMARGGGRGEAKSVVLLVFFRARRCYCYFINTCHLKNTKSNKIKMLTLIWLHKQKRNGMASS